MSENDNIYTRAATNYLKKCRGRSRGPRKAFGKLERGTSMEAQSERALRVVVRRATLQRRRLTHRGVLGMGRIERG